ncbi:NAD(P)H-dependent oxidoreductase [Paenibacillus sp. SYP-B3998]|uniref:NAD(P)H-dependent oxidoreductase n=1 Tax=Paenibacillus sp. SYP-B3998 TaxID=2678564 RepID=A0A6G3ZXX2_9BACL|nr:NAD(P)H-dependent oxidoreductase [Paenibacillus sp. SYP-B3998]NEW06898.1 NAD(P)H-dependent oxidoreductase [Paenibacillus sp. SYP-B3998]
MKTLVVVTHPSIETSVINKRWVEELKKYPEKYTVHELHKAYPDGNIDVEKEQKLVELHSNLVLQFPIYWFNCPPLLKKWLDDVLTYGWAYGSNGGDKLKNRKTALAVSVGIKKEDYSEEGRYHYTLDHLLSPFETTFLYCNANYRSFFAFYGTENEPGENVPSTENEPSESQLEKSALNYLNFVDNL